MASKLGITDEITWFPNPAREGEVIYWFYDVPHLLKRVRDNFLKYGFHLADGSVLHISMFDRLLEKMGSPVATNRDMPNEISMAYKLTDRRLFDVRGQDAQSVGTAAKLFSETMHDAIQYYFNDQPKMVKLAEFCLSTDRWFDVLNSSKQVTPGMKNAKSPFEVHLQEQSHYLNEYIEIIRGLRVIGKNSLMPWQHGVIISSTSCIKIYHDIIRKYGQESVLTVDFSQDKLENTFSVLRSMGGAESRFGSVRFIYRLRDYILGVGRDLSVQTASVLCKDDGAKVLTRELAQDFVKDQTPVEILEIEEMSEVSKYSVQASRKLRKQRKLVVTLSLPDDDQVPNIVELQQYKDQLNSEEEGWNKFAAHLGDKHAKDFVTLINGEYKKEDFVASKWLQAQKHVPINLPKKSFVADIKRMDESFQNYHHGAQGPFSPLDLLRTPQVINNFFEILVRDFSQYPKKLLHAFARSRTFFRMRHMQQVTKKIESARSIIKRVGHLY